MKNEYYDGTKLLSLKDLRGKKPEIYMATSNRTAGKTTYFSRLLINHFLKTGEKFVLLYRNKYQLKGCAEEFFKDQESLFFHGMVMEEELAKKDVYANLYLDNSLCGYAVALNAAEQVKRCSALLSDAWAALFDEFQSENNTYCPNEIKKFRSIHASIARGNGKMVRYFPVFMVSNLINILNPYYVSMGIYKKLQANTKFLRGDGYVLEQGYNRKAADLAKESAFNRAFAGDSYDQLFGERTYLYDHTAFIQKMSGKSDYFATISYQGKQYGVREFAASNLLYVDERPDIHYPIKIAADLIDHAAPTIMLGRSSPMIFKMRQYFEFGRFRFQSVAAKDALLTTIAYI